MTKLSSLLVKFLLLVSTVFSTNSMASGGILALTDVLEEVRIKVIPITASLKAAGSKSKKEGSHSQGLVPPLGSISSEYIDCKHCKKVVHQYGSSTVLINPFGKKLSIKDIKKWNGSRAEVHYRVTDNYIELIKILP